jgi:hypothetical protein
MDVVVAVLVVAWLVVMVPAAVAPLVRDPDRSGAPVREVRPLPPPIKEPGDRSDRPAA